MGAPILWTPGIFAFFLQENLHVHKFLVLEVGGHFGFWERGGSADFILFYGRGDFLISERERDAHFSEDWQVACFPLGPPTPKKGGEWWRLGNTSSGPDLLELGRIRNSEISEILRKFHFKRSSETQTQIFRNSEISESPSCECRKFPSF